MFIYLSLTLFAIIFLWLQWNYSFWKRNGVPCPESAYFLGHIGGFLFLKTHMMDLCEKWYKTYSNVPYIGFYKLTTPAIMCRDLDLIKNILVTDHLIFHGNIVDFNTKYDILLAKSPVSLTGDRWKHARSMLIQCFSVTKLKSHFPHMENSSKKLVNYMKNNCINKDIDAKLLTLKYTTHNIMNVIYNMDTDCYENTNCESMVMGRKIFPQSLLAGLRFMLFFEPVTLINLFLHVQFLPTEVDKWARRLCNEYIQSKKCYKTEDMMNSLLTIRERIPMTDEEITAYTVHYFTEGTETTAGVMMWALYEMAREPITQEKLYAEILEYRKKYNNEINYDIICEMKYLDCVMKETLRMNTPTSVVTKKCSAPYKLPLLKTQKEPMTLTPGMTVNIPVREIHHDPKYYPNPYTFNPDRFSEENSEIIPKFAFIPFSEGPRMCPGFRFALPQMKAGIVAIIGDFQVKLSANHKPIEIDRRMLTYEPKESILLNFAPRRSAT